MVIPVLFLNRRLRYDLLTNMDAAMPSRVRSLSLREVISPSRKRFSTQKKRELSVFSYITTYTVISL